MVRWSTSWTLAVGLLLGLSIGAIDSRPGWDDTGVTAAAVFLSAAMLAAIHPRSSILTGLSVGVPVLLLNVLMHRGFGALFAVGVALLGAALGWTVGRMRMADRAH